ncbi:epimerase family protein SDR39U1 [Trichuris trichiura]|uniref:Epimerase family protein SDR39U1 n=1 Tax=Trichuris trichiura TaxID=36087 RepID=A0A077ZF59_TRITR|nr:epimerase family protein SDR39U1 [Trichuris trichiura]
MSVLVGGGTGFIGSVLVKQIKTIKLKPIIVTRKPRAVDHVTWNHIAETGLPADCVGVVNLAGANIGDPLRRFAKEQYVRWTSEYKKEIYNSRISTTKLLAEVLQKCVNRPVTFITTSAVGIYPPDESRIYTESNHVSSYDDFFCSLCKDWEAAGNLGDSSIHRRVIIRNGIVLGRHGGIIKQIYLPFCLGLGGPLASGQQPFPWIHLDDIVGIYMHALTSDKVSSILNGVAPSLITNAEFAKAFGCILRRPTLFRVPEFALNLIFGTERAEMLIKGQKVHPERTLASGYVFKYPDIKDAMRQIVHG